MNAPLRPVRITLQIQVLKTKTVKDGEKGLISRAFFAHFADGTVKVRCIQKWGFTFPLTEREIQGEEILLQKCPMHFEDWGDKPERELITLKASK